MKLADLTTGTVYQIGADSSYRSNEAGALLNATAWIVHGERTRPSGDRSPRYEQNPDGYYGRKVWGMVSPTYRDVRGLLVITTSGTAMTEDYIGDPNDPDDPDRAAADSIAERDARIARLPEIAAAALTAIEADPLARPEIPDGYQLRVLRPQDIPRPWAEHLENERAGREARRAYEIEQEGKAQLQCDARARLIAVVSPPEDDLRPYGPWHGDPSDQRLSWTALEALCERYAAGKAAGR